MDLEVLIHSIDIVEYIGQFVELEQKNDEFWGLSPFKEEKTPSFSVRPDPPFFYDYSAGFGGNVFHFVKRLFRCSSREAVEKLKQYAGVHGEIDSPAEKIVLRAGERQAKYLRSLPLHASQIELSAPEAASLGYDSDSGAVFVLRLAPTLDFIQYLLSQGDELEVLAPESLRADIARRAAAIADLYR